MARILTSLLYEYKYIRKNQCVEIDGNFFLGLSPGESSAKTNVIVQASRGGVLFIDEAYSLATNSNGQEVVATLVKAMEDHRDDTVFVFAGYENLMKDFIGINPGIESRVKYFINFPNYSKKELSAIFMQMAHEQNFKVSKELLELAASKLQEDSRKKNFGNARSVRVLLDRIIDVHAINVSEGAIERDGINNLSAKDMP